MQDSKFPRLWSVSFHSWTRLHVQDAGRSTSQSSVFSVETMKQLNMKQTNLLVSFFLVAVCICTLQVNDTRGACTYIFWHTWKAVDFVVHHSLSRRKNPMKNIRDVCFLALLHSHFIQKRFPLLLCRTFALGASLSFHKRNCLSRKSHQKRKVDWVDVDCWY